MSRIGKIPVKIVSGVTANIDGNVLSIKGPKGELTLDINNSVNVQIIDDSISVFPKDTEDKMSKSMYGTTRALVQNMVLGVTEGFEKVLEIVGVGYKVQQNGSGIKLWLGFSHTIEVQPMDGITLKVDGENKIIITGYDKQKVGEQTANIRQLRKPEPYKGKGVRYINNSKGVGAESIKMKQGKKISKK